MKVILDARKISHGGIGLYVYNLIKLYEINNYDYFLIINKNKNKLEQERLNSLKLKDYLELDLKAFSVIEQANLSFEINKLSKFDIFHSPYIPLVSEINSKIKKVLTIHDLIYLSKFYPFYKRIIFKYLINKSIKNADLIQTVSNSSLNLISKITNKKIDLVPNTLFLSDTVSYKDRNKILIILSNTKKHKRVKDIVRFLNTNKLNQEVVVIGQIDKLKINNLNKITYKLRVSDTELYQNFQKAKCLIIPSLIEGFCIQALISRYYAVPIICRPDAAISSFCLKEDSIAKSFSYKDFKDLILKNINTPTDFEAFRKKSINIFNQYKPETIAKTLDASYKQVLK